MCEFNSAAVFNIINLSSSKCSAAASLRASLPRWTRPIPEAWPNRLLTKSSILASGALFGECDTASPTSGIYCRRPCLRHLGWKMRCLLDELRKLANVDGLQRLLSNRLD
jgi:hypothetical protein